MILKTKNINTMKESNIISNRLFSVTLHWTWIFVVVTLLTPHKVVLSQKVPFAQHYDEAHKSRSPGESNSSQNNYRGNGNVLYNNNSSSSSDHNTRYQDKDLRDFPDHNSINWLSPNPFAVPGTGSDAVNNRQSTNNNPFQGANNNITQYPTNPNDPNYGRQNNNNLYNQNNPATWPQQGTNNPSGSQNNNRNIPFPSSNDRQRNPTSMNDPFAFDPNRSQLDQYGRERDRGGVGDFNVNSNTVPVDGLGNRRDEDSGGVRTGSVDPRININRQYNSPTYTDIRERTTQNPRPFGFGPDVGPRSGYPSNYPGSSISDGNTQQQQNSSASFYPGGYPQSASGNYPSSGINPYDRVGGGDGAGASYGQSYPKVGLGSGIGTTFDHTGRRNIPPFVNYPGRGNFDPGYPNVNSWNEYWTTTTYRPTAPGVLGRWRTDLQGQQRPEDINQVPQSVYVMTTFGRIQGFKTKIYDGPWVPLPARPGIANVDKVKSVVSSFVGIPYARAPTHEGRFRPPRSHPGWQLHQAVEVPPACPQPARFFGHSAGIIQVHEDCLFLNVYSPDVGSGVEGAPFPVIFYIHDGDFIHGASHQFPPHQLVGWYKLVVVTVNFRLGSLGFMSTGDEHSPGNYGMLDLTMALKWVHENIHSFNGDPERITLVGLGSGAAAAGLLMLSPQTKQLVKNVVALEGAMTADWAAIVDQYRVQNTTQLYSFKMGCWQDFETTSWKMVQCLRSRSWQELANLELDPDVGTFPWSPVVDRTFRVPKDDYLNDWKEEDWRFLPDTPHNLLKTGNYPFVKYMTGFSRQSAADLLFANKTIAPNYVVSREWFDEQINLWVKKYNYTLNPEGVFSAIKYAYTYWPDPKNTTHLREEYIDFLSDALYRAPIDEAVKLLLARGIQVHMYMLNYTLEGLRLPFWREVPRGMEYYMLSGAPFMDPEFYPERLRVDRFAWTEGDRNMSNFLMTSVANMAYYGQPTPREVLGIYWERATPADLKYLALNGTNNSTIQRNYRQRELTFWSEYMPSVVGHLVATYPPTTEYWEPNEPLQIAFWSVSGICLILIVALVACCLLWRTAKKQRDRIYDDLGLGSEPLRMGSMGGDEMSEYAETVKTIDSMDSGRLKYSHRPDPPQQHQQQRFPPASYSTQSTVHNGSHLRDTKDRFHVPIKKAGVERGGRETPQTTV
ncbi:Neuroligin-4, Y-linked [Folsomia candida]|uniref:Neuroligin-4, Y-linked n=1 Tax=Folsomia candida TaxID=158441 RepID=A0A226ELT8_FOLCA|nr:Neuroligin-4, Y-linked [Folsomia candida]